jgi:poly(3-hydroxybutyrate) depolymerase
VRRTPHLTIRGSTTTTVAGAATAVAVALGVLSAGGAPAATAATTAGSNPTARALAVPATPHLRVRREATSAVLSWAAVARGASYRVLNDAGAVVWAGKAHTTTRSRLRPGTRYGWTVRAVGPHGGLSVPSPEVFLALPADTPSGLSATVTAAGVSLHWQPTPGAVRFRVVASDALGHHVGPARSVAGLSTSLTGLAPGSTTAWSVSAVGTDGAGSPWTPSVQVTAPTATPPTPTAAVSGGAPAPGLRSAVTLSWTAVPGAAAYDVYNHFGRRIQRTTVPGATIRGLPPGTLYTFTVASVDPAGFVSPPSPAVSVVTPRRPDPAVSTRTLTWGGIQRTYLVAIPSATLAGTSGPAPAVVMLHGLDDTAANFLATTRILQPALAAGEVVIAPESIDGIWNDGRLDEPGKPGRDDVGFVMAAVDTLVNSGMVDPARVTVAGFSNGAGLAMRIAATDPDQVAELVSFSGALLSDGRAVLPTVSVPAVLIHGDADRTQPWIGRPQINPDLPAQMSQPATRKVWQLTDGDAGPAAVTRIAAPAWAPALSSTIVQSWTATTPTSTPFTFYKVPGGTHSWPYEPCAVGANSGCSADARTDAQPEPFDGTALLVGIAETAHR